MTDLMEYIGKDVEVTLYRKKKFKKYHGTLIYAGYNEICLVKNGVSKWVNRPNRFRDHIKEVVE